MAAEGWVGRRHLKHPPTAVGGIMAAEGWVGRRHLKHPPTPVGGIRSSARPFLLRSSVAPRIPPAEAGGSFLCSLQTSSLYPQRIPPTAVGGYFKSCLPAVPQKCPHQRCCEFAAGSSVRRAFPQSVHPCPHENLRKVFRHEILSVIHQREHARLHARLRHNSHQQVSMIRQDTHLINGESPFFRDPEPVATQLPGSRSIKHGSPKLRRQDHMMTQFKEGMRRTEWSSILIPVTKYGWKKAVSVSVVRCLGHQIVTNGLPVHSPSAFRQKSPRPYGRFQSTH